MTPDELELERDALLAEIEQGQPLTEEQARRVIDLAMADRENAALDQSIHGRIQRDLSAQLAELFVASGITDAVFASTTLSPSDDGIGTDVYVESRSRGRVSIGTLPYLVVQARAGVIAVPYAEELEAKRAAPLTAKARQKAEHIQRAVELHEAGNSPNRIAQIMTAERGKTTDPRVVRDWLAMAKSRMDRERSV
jgi:hypothetical protein